MQIPFSNIKIRSSLFVVGLLSIDAVKLNNDTPSLCQYYEGRPICSDNGLISQKLLLKSKVYYPLHVAMGVDYSCLKYQVLFITT